MCIIIYKFSLSSYKILKIVFQSKLLFVVLRSMLSNQTKARVCSILGKLIVLAEIDKAQLEQLSLQFFLNQVGK